MVTDIYFNILLVIIDLNNNNQEFYLYFSILNLRLDYCTFNLKGEFILYSEVKGKSTFGSQKIIWIYSTQTKNNKWECKRFYRIPEDYELINISKYDKVYLCSNDYIYEWNIITEKSVKIFGNKDKNKVINIIKLFSNQSMLNILNINYFF